MHRNDAALTAVLRTLLRATADARAAVVLRCDRPAQARALARWLGRAHGSRRVVIASRTLPAQVEVFLPPRVPWPDGAPLSEGLAPRGTGRHFSRMNFHGPDGRDR